MKITEEKLKDKINNIIKTQSNPITADNIFTYLTTNIDPGRTQETIRKFIREMVSSGEYLIGSSNKGYFKIRTSEQAQDAIEYLRNRIPDLQSRANSIRETWNQNHPDNPID